MSEQMELPIRRERVALIDDSAAAPKSEAVDHAGRARIRLVQREPMYTETEALHGFSEAVMGKTPPSDGWWNTRVNGTEEYQRLWFQASTDPVTGGGMWYEQRAQGGLKFVGSHAEIGGQLWWLGLAQPWWLGYSWPVPGAKRVRLGLE